MTPKEHAALLRTVSIVWFVGWILACLFLGSRESAAVGLLVYFFALPVVWQLLLWFVPVECDQSGCQGSVWHKWGRQEGDDYGIHYVCDQCGHEWNGPVSISFDGDP